MAYVALSRVRSPAGLHLSVFDPKSIIVSTSCLAEVNMLRGAFRSDLPLYQMPPKAIPNRKRKITGNNSSVKKIMLSGAATSDLKTLPQPLYTSHRKCKRSQSPKRDNETTASKMY